MNETTHSKTLIGILASHDSPQKNNALARLLEKLREEDWERLDKFHFVFTGGTYERIILGTEKAREQGINPVNPDTRKFLIPRSTYLPSRRDGGVTVLAYSAVQRACSIIWPFLTPVTAQ